jgi:hypothetical protein
MKRAVIENAARLLMDALHSWLAVTYENAPTAGASGQRSFKMQTLTANLQLTKMV